MGREKGFKRSATQGRKKGTPNKNISISALVKQAFLEVGGVEYLKDQALSEPRAFLGLLGKFIAQAQLPAPILVDSSKTINVSFKNATRFLKGMTEECLEISETETESEEPLSQN